MADFPAGFVPDGFVPDQPAAQSSQPSTAKAVVNAAAEALPAAGGIVGGLVGGVPGAAILGMAGEGYKQLAQHFTEIPGAVKDVARNLIAQPGATIRGMVEGEQQGADNAALAGGVQGAVEAAGAGAMAGAGKLGKWLMNRATTRVTAQLSREFPELSDTLIDNALTVSQGGYEKAKVLLAAAKSKATAAVARADSMGAQIPVEVTPDLAESLKTALLEKAVKTGNVAPPAAGQPVTTAIDRLSAPMKALFKQVDYAAENGVPINLKPSEADIFKTQLQKEARNAVYLNRIAPNGAKAVSQDATVIADYAAKLNDAIDQAASGYRAANKEAQPLIGAVRGLKQAIRPSGNLYQAMVRPGAGLVLGGLAGRQEGGTPGAAIGGMLGATATTPTMLSREAIALSHPAVQSVLRQIPKPFADRVRAALLEALPPTPDQTSPSGSSQ